MKKRNKVLPLISAICLVFSGCASGSNETSSVVDSNSDKQSNMADDSSVYEVIQAQSTYSDGFPCLDFETRYENIKNQYPDKTILVWALIDAIRYEDDINQYLTTELDSDYVICFKSYEEYDIDITAEESGWTGSYFSLLEEDVSNGEQTDILSSGVRYIGYDSFTDSYRHLASEGMLEPLDEYLEETDMGKELKNSVPDNYWESLKYNGSVYGFDGSLTCLGSSVGYNFNSELCDKLGIDTDEFRGSYENTAGKIFDVCKKNGLTFSVHYLDSMEMYLDDDFITMCVYIDDEGRAANVYESDETKKLFKAVEKGYSENCVQVGLPYDLDSYFGECTAGSIGGYSRDGVKTNEFYGLSTGDNTVEAYAVYPVKNKELHSAAEATGICSSSEYKDMAFDALATVMTDKKLNDLICYGTDCEIADGLATPGGYYSTPRGVDNMLIRTPFNGVQSSEMNKSAREALENSAVSPFAGFYFDTSNVSKQILAVDDIVLSVSDEFPTEKYSDAEEYLDYLNERLYDAGLQDILDEANRQLEEYK